jgi:predicted dehydrogenase
MTRQNTHAPLTRRNFVKTSTASAATLAGLTLASGSKVHAAGSDKLRVGLLGCGGRGAGAAANSLRAAENVEIHAMADLFGDKLERARELIAGEADKAGMPAGASVQVPPERMFSGFDAYKQLLDTDIDIVLLCCPPGFRARHLQAAVDAGKHVFMEKPGGVDPVGVRALIAASEQAEQKGLCIVAGTQRRHEAKYLEIMKRIHDGAIGEIVAGQIYWVCNMEKWHFTPRQPAWSDMEWQIRNWPYFAWLSGDHFVEQHLHNIDVMNWAMGEVPKQVMALGGRQVRVGPEFGHIYDHFAAEFEFANGVRFASYARQIEGCANRVAERIVGTKGVAEPSSGIITGANPFELRKSPNPYVQEHTDLINAIRSGTRLNEGKRLGESTMTAICGRMSAYTGRQVDYDWVRNESQEHFGPEKFEFGDLPVDPVAMPGTTKLI